MKKLVLILFFALIANAADKFDYSKRYCKEMKSCDEAYYYLKECGHAVALTAIMTVYHARIYAKNVE